MIGTTIKYERERIEFAEEAANHFRENPKHWTYGGDPTPGEFLALRWGMGDDCVLVLRVGDETPVIYGQAI